jgi:hypothetical protein
VPKPNGRGTPSKTRRGLRMAFLTVG